MRLEGRHSRGLSRPTLLFPLTFSPLQELPSTQSNWTFHYPLNRYSLSSLLHMHGPLQPPPSPSLPLLLLSGPLQPPVHHMQLCIKCHPGIRLTPPVTHPKILFSFLNASLVVTHSFCLQRLPSTTSHLSYGHDLITCPLTLTCPSAVHFQHGSQQQHPPCKDPLLLGATGSSKYLGAPWGTDGYLPLRRLYSAGERRVINNKVTGHKITLDGKQ